MSAPVGPLPTSPDTGAPVSYWAIVGGQLRKKRMAMGAAYAIAVLLSIAIGAPLLCFSLPILLHHPGVGASSPVAEALFDRNLFPGGVDVFFNLLLVVVPWWLTAPAVAHAVLRKRPIPVVRTVLLALVVLLEGGAALGGARSVGVFATIGGMGGAGILLAGRLNPGRRGQRRRLARGVVVALVVACFLAALRRTDDQRPTASHEPRVANARAAGGFALFPPVPFHPANATETSGVSTTRSLKSPDAANWIGCDMDGRDVLSRLVFGTRVSLTIGIVAVSIFIAIGVALGSLAGYYRGWVDIAISRFIEVMLCFPTLFLILTIIAIFDSRNIFMIMAVIGLTGWPGVARLVRGEFLRQRGLDYVTAAQALGVPQRRIIFGHLLPNCIGPVLVSATFGIASSILTESTIAFLGLGDTSAPSWGQMLTQGREQMVWHLILAPGAAVFLVVFVFNLVGEGVRDALDPKMRR